MTNRKWTFLFLSSKNQYIAVSIIVSLYGSADLWVQNHTQDHTVICIALHRQSGKAIHCQLHSTQLDRIRKLHFATHTVILAPISREGTPNLTSYSIILSAEYQ